MKIKKFTARTFAEALAQVKKELSENAVILATEERTGLRPHVEVTAAADYDLDAASPAFGQAAGLGRRPPAASGTPTHRSAGRPAAPAAAAPPRPAAAPAARPPRQAHPAHGDARVNAYAAAQPREDAHVAGLKEELNSLRSMIEGMKSSGFELSLPPQKRAMVRFLRERAVRDEYALRISEKARSIDELPRCLASDIAVRRPGGGAKAVMLIGPTGVGKTTTVAKLAAHAVRSGKKAAIINLDTYRIGAIEQVRIYARILGIPLAVAGNIEEFRKHLRTFAANRDVVFIDTVGRNPRDEAHLREIAEACSADVPPELHLLMGANTDDQCMIEAYTRYRTLPISCIGFTKVDEAVRFGPLYNLLLTYQKPVAYLTTGQQVPADIEFPTADRIAGLIVSEGCCA